MTNLKSRRDELAELWVTKWSSLDGEALAINDYKAGFDAAISELKPEIDELVKALEHINGDGFEYCEYCSNFGVSDDVVLKHYDKLCADALTKYKEFMGGGE